MKCTCCGQELNSSERFCPNCGENNEGYVEVAQSTYRDPVETPTVNQEIKKVPIYTNDNQSSQNASVLYYHQTNVTVQAQAESAAVAVLALVFSCLGGWLGLVFSIIGLSKYKTPKYRAMCGVSLGIFIAWIIFLIILYACL